MRLLIVLSSFILLVGCAPAPTPTPPLKTEPVPITAPESSPVSVDNPSYSEEEISASIWSDLPNDLQGEYKKSQFSRNTRGAIYQGNGKWRFEVFGHGESKVTLPETIDISPEGDSGIERHHVEITTYELQLTADFYERTNTLEILSIKKFNIETKIEASETPIYPKLLLNWMTGQYDGSEHYYEGSVTNISKIPLKNIEIEIDYFDSDQNFIVTQKFPLYPDTIAPRERAHFKGQFYERIDIRFYTWSFISPSGIEIPYERKDKD